MRYFVLLISLFVLPVQAADLFIGGGSIAYKIDTCSDIKKFDCEPGEGNGTAIVGLKDNVGDTSIYYSVQAWVSDTPSVNLSSGYDFGRFSVGAGVGAVHIPVEFGVDMNTTDSIVVGQAFVEGAYNLTDSISIVGVVGAIDDHRQRFTDIKINPEARVASKTRKVRPVSTTTSGEFAGISVVFTFD